MTEQELLNLKRQIEAIQDYLDQKVEPMLQDYMKRFGYSVSKNCPHCGHLLGAPAPNKMPAYCPRCERKLQ